jgi:CRISPR/Cas system CSM-associated protein Csm3 (group 7 of RAMP superfamily)
MASHIAVSDLLVEPELWYGQFEVRQGVAIDRDTETAANSLLYDFEVVPAETRFRLDIACDNLAEWQRGLLWLGVQRFVDGEVAIGGGRSRGLGRVQLENPVWSGWELGSDRISSMLDLVSHPWQPIPTGTMPAGWRTALEQRLKEAMRV